MLIKLPVIKNDLIDIINFTIENFQNKFIIKPLNMNKDDRFEIMISNKEFCLNKFTIQFPLQLEILDNKYIFSKFFFVVAVSNGFDCELNFFSNILNHIKKKNSKLTYVDLNFLKNKSDTILKKCNLEIIVKKKFDDFIDFKLYLDDQLNYSINLIYLILYKYHNLNNKDFKQMEINQFLPNKVINGFNLIKNYKTIFKGSESIQISNHLENLKNNKIIEVNLKTNNYYFFKVGEKIIKTKLLKVDEDSIFLIDGRILPRKDCEIFNYNPQFISHLNFDYFIKDLVKYDFLFKKLISTKIFKKETKDIENIIHFFYRDTTDYLKLSSLRNLDYMFNDLNLEHYNDKNKNLEIKILEDGYINNDYMLYLTNKYKDDIDMKNEVLSILFNKYTFPLSFNKKKLNENFEMIMYFSLLNYSDFIVSTDSEKLSLNSKIIEIVPAKLKNLFFNLLKTYYQIVNNSLENITYNFKYYQDYIYIYVIKNIIQSNSILTNLFKTNVLFNKLIETYKKNFILTQLISEIKWSNLSDRLNYLDYIYDNSDLVFYQNKLNRNLFSDNIDYKIKNIILDKMSMYKYLKKEKDFIKWTKFIKKYVCNIFEKEISISNEDLENLGILLFKIYNLDEQNLKNPKYIDLLTFSKTNKKLILINNRINLLIREKLSGIKCQLNLGYFAKHLNQNIDEKIEIAEDNEIKKMELELKQVTKKYYKYKGKYMKTKTTTSTDI